MAPSGTKGLGGPSNPPSNMPLMGLDVAQLRSSSVTVGKKFFASDSKPGRKRIEL